jgi:hypothetical protein
MTTLEETQPAAATGRGRLIFFLILGFFLLSMVGTIIFSSYVVSQARRDAASADESIRVVGWWCLLYADQHEGEFPTSFQQLSTAAWRETLNSALLTTPPVDWPLSHIDAGLASVADPAGTLRLAEQATSVRFSAASNVPPTVNADGKPSYVGTIDAVNGWLAHAADRARMARDLTPR